MEPAEPRVMEAIEENMKNDLNVRTVGIVGCGLIGMSWAAYYLAKGFAVRATDPMAEAEKKLYAYIDSAWALLQEWVLSQAPIRTT
jgi:carnitine 3-dehydrogenase